MIGELITALVRSAPELPAEIVASLRAELAACERDRELADAIARVLGLVADGRVAAGAALPHLAMACETLLDERLTARERAAARHEVETFLPGDPVPDVAADQLIRGPRPRT